MKCPECQRLGLESKITVSNSICFPPYNKTQNYHECSNGHHWDENYYYENHELEKIEISFFVSK